MGCLSVLIKTIRRTPFQLRDWGVSLMNRLPPASPARRHFMGIVAAGAGGLSTIAISSSLLAALQVKNADALGTLPRGDPHRGGGPNCFARGTLILTAHGEVRPLKTW